MSNCQLLKQIQNLIATGTPPDEAIPYSIECADEADYIEVLYYAGQVLPDGERKSFCLQRLKEVKDVTRTDQRGH